MKQAGSLLLVGVLVVIGLWRMLEWIFAHEGVPLIVRVLFAIGAVLTSSEALGVVSRGYAESRIKHD